MSLYSQLQQARSEEDVKDAYIKALSLKGFTKGLIDIRTKEIWFEAKDTGKTSSYAMFTQLLHYVHDALKKGEEVPPFLAVIDTEKAALMKTSDVKEFLTDKKNDIKWGKSASQYTPDALAKISAYIGAHFVSFKIATHEEEFISTVKAAILSGDIIRTPITPDNLKQVFDKWVEMIGREINGVAEEDYALLFFADIMHDGTVSTHDNLPAELLHKNGAPVFSLAGKNYELGNKEGYRRFWAIYHKPPKAEHRDYLLERRDSLIPLDERSFKGAYYTPLAVVDKAYDKLAETLGKNWQREYIVWDMCCGVGNLEVKHSNPRNIYMSTLDQADVDVMKATKTCVAATRFQYDYLNDDIVDASTMSAELFAAAPVAGEPVAASGAPNSARTVGSIDYSLTNKMPLGLRQAIAEGKKILVLINPPYAESGSGVDSGNKEGVATTKMSSVMEEFGYAKRELFAQFLVRIYREIPTATVAMFSTLKYVVAPNFELFRQIWRAQYLGGFVVHNKAFDGLNGNFPIGFLVWATNQNLTSFVTEISADVLDKKAKPIGEKFFYNLPSEQLLTKWVVRPKPNKTEALPLKNAIVPATKTKDVRGTYWSDNAIACLYAHASDMQNANLTALLSSGYSSPGAFFVNKENLWQAAIVFTVRRVIKQTWLNDRDQFLQPSQPLSDEFKADCLIWMLFNGSNLTAGANDLEWNDKKWSLVNHFIPYTEAEVGAPDRFESDFMVNYLAELPALVGAYGNTPNGNTPNGNTPNGNVTDAEKGRMPYAPTVSVGAQFSAPKDSALSPEARAVLDAGRTLWQAYFAHTDVRTVRDEFKLNRPDVGWYQIRNALKKRNESGDTAPVDFTPFETAYKTLSEKLQPQVFELGFLK
jgi:hypothetical protein